MPSVVHFFNPTMMADHNQFAFTSSSLSPTERHYSRSVWQSATVWPVALWQVWHSSPHESPTSWNNNDETTEHGSCTSAKDTDATAVLLLQAYVQERANTPSCQHPLPCCPYTASCRKSNTFLCLLSRDGVWTELQKPKTARKQWAPLTRRDRQGHHTVSPVQSKNPWMTWRQSSHVWVPASVLEL